MYDLHWDEDAAAPNESKAAFQFAPSAADATSLAQRTATVEKTPETLEVEDGDSSQGDVSSSAWHTYNLGPLKSNSFFC